MGKTKAYHVKETKKQKQKTWIRVSGHEYVCAYIGLRTRASCMCMHTSSLRTHAEEYTRRHALNPNPKTQKCKR